MEIREYWQEKKKAELKLVRDLLSGKLPGQPELEDGINPETDEPCKVPVAVYLVSVRNRTLNTTGGTVCLAAVKVAAGRIADGTHAVATEDQIKQYLEQQLEQLQLHRKLDAQAHVRKTVAVREEDINPIPAHLQPAHLQPKKR